MNFDFRRGIVYLNNSEKVNMFDFGVDSLEIYYDNEEPICNDRLFYYSRPVPHVILKCDCLEFNIEYIFTLSDDEFMKILNSFLKVKESLYRIKKYESVIKDIIEKYRVINMFPIGYEKDESYIKYNKMIDDNSININNTLNELKGDFSVDDKSEYYIEGTHYYKYVIN